MSVPIYSDLVDAAVRMSGCPSSNRCKAKTWPKMRYSAISGFFNQQVQGAVRPGSHSPKSRLERL